MPEPSLGAWLLSVLPGRAWLLAPAAEAALRLALEDEEPPADGRLALLLPLAGQDRPDTMAQAVADGLAATAAAAFPDWFGLAEEPGLSAALADDPAADSWLDRCRAAQPGLSRAWARHALARLRAGRLPRVPEVTPALELRQLALAVSGGPLSLVVLPDRVPEAAAADAFARGLEWLAGETGAAVVAALPVAPEALPPALLRLPLHRVPPPPPAAPALPWAGPIRGRPHWASAAEQRLAQGLAGHARLAGRFACNQPVRVRDGRSLLVDLLCAEARLVVEVDGFADHGTREAFARDRERDFALLVSGYQVVRLTAEQVLADLPLALAKLEEAFIHCASKAGTDQP